MSRGESKTRRIAKRIERISQQNPEGLTPEAVVADARNPKSPLHKEFEWDDSIAGQKFRLHQARELIKRVRVHVQTTTREIRVAAYVRDPALDPTVQGYVAVTRLRDDDARARDAVRYSAQRAAAHLQHTRDLAVAVGLEGELDRILSSFAAFREQLNV